MNNAGKTIAIDEVRETLIRRLDTSDNSTEFARMVLCQEKGQVKFSKFVI